MNFRLKHKTTLLLAATSLVSALSSWAIQPGDKVDNFTLTDEHGNEVELYSLQDKEAVVVMVQGNGCPIVRNAIHTFHKLRDRYEAKNIAFLMLNANI